MGELKAISGNEIREDIDYNTRGVDPENKEWRNYGKELCDTLYYRKSEADKVIAEKDAEICRLKNGIAPKYSDKTLQERLNEVCEKHGVSTLQDLDWAFCMTEKRYTKDIIEAVKIINDYKYKLCLAMAKWCKAEQDAAFLRYNWDTGRYADVDFYEKWHKRWLELAEKFKEAK